MAGCWGHLQHVAQVWAEGWPLNEREASGGQTLGHPEQEQYQISKLSNVNEIIKNINKDEDKDKTDTRGTL